MIRNIAASLVLYETVDTTEAKAKDTKCYLEKIIARNKAADLSAHRRLIAEMFDRNAAKKIMEELLPRYENRKSGFIRSFHLKNRDGDNAPMMRLELVDKKVFVNAPKKEAKEVKSKKTAVKSDKIAEGSNSAKATLDKEKDDK